MHPIFRWLVLVAISWLSFLFIGFVLANETRPSNDHEAVIQVAMDYARGVAENDRQRIERAYLTPKAQLKLVEKADGNERLFVIPIQEVMEKVWLKTPPVEQATIQVLHLHVVAGKMATILIDNNGQFIDMLSLYKINGSWRIVDKLAIRHPQAAPLNLNREGLFGAQDL